MPEVMMAIGDFIFAVDTAAYQKLTVTSPWRWANQDRIGREPSLQFIGADIETIDLEGVVFPGWNLGSTADLDRLRELAAEGEPLDLVDGQGDVWGQYVIEEVEDVWTTFHSNGAPRKVEFKIRIKLYGEDVVEDDGVFDGADGFGEGAPLDVPDDVAALMSVDPDAEPALTAGGNNGSFGVMEALALGRMAQSAFAGGLTGTVAGTLGVALGDDGSIVITGEAGIGVGLDGIGRVGIGKSLSVVTGGGSSEEDLTGGGAAP